MALTVAFLVTAVCAVPISLSAWALLDAASRPEWAWALAGRRRVVWMAAVFIGTLTLVPGIAIAGWYLTKVRPVIRAAEDGLLR